MYKQQVQENFTPQTPIHRYLQENSNNDHNEF